MRIYVVGSSENVLLVAYDIYGFENGSWIKELCDFLATQGYLVILMDFFKGDAWPVDFNLDFLNY